MGHVIVEDLVKTFRIREPRSPGVSVFRDFIAPRYRELRALDGMGFQIERGELVAYVGPNGAGKSTTIKVLSGILIPTSGRCEVGGLVPSRERKKHVARIGVVFGQRTQLFWDLPLYESFSLLRAIYGVSWQRHRELLAELTEQLELGAFMATPVRQLSLGQRMRGELAASLLHDPELLFLDEPTIGLDAVSKLSVRDFIRRRNRERNTTVILTTHDFDDIEAVCNRVLVVAQGKLLCDGTLDELRRSVSRERRLIVDLVDPEIELAACAARVLRREGSRFTLGFDPQMVSPAALISDIASRHAIRDLFVEHPPIEEVVAELYRKIEGRA